MLKKISKLLLPIIFVFSFVLVTPVKADLLLTQEERDYIADNPTLKAVSVKGIAPFIYVDSKGQYKGISVIMLNKISTMTGLKFEYTLYDTVDESLESDYDLYVNANKGYAPDYMMLSRSYLKVDTILYVNSLLDVSQLEDKIYAGVKGGKLPQGVREDKAIFFDSREDTMNAIEQGKADYSYGNPYSVAFYTLQNGYKNITTIPLQKEMREYCIGVLQGSEILLSIMNKAIDSISENEMQIIILDATSRVERKLTFLMVLEQYGMYFLVFSFFFVMFLLWSIYTIVRSHKKLQIQNKRYEMLSHISNEYLFEFDKEKNQLTLSEESTHLFGDQEAISEATQCIKKHLVRDDKSLDNLTMELTTANGEQGIFKIVASNIYDNKGRAIFISGKLIDISKEIAEKKDLIFKSKRDGLTGLYNAVTTRELIIARIEAKVDHQSDALIMLDYDKFKLVNDTFGHLVGDRVLKNLSEALKITFGETGIIGRIGGDEFCIYLCDVPSREFIEEKCAELAEVVKMLNNQLEQPVHTSMSFGVKIWTGPKNDLKSDEIFEELVKIADTALYQVKRNGGGQTLISR